MILANENVTQSCQSIHIANGLYMSLRVVNDLAESEVVVIQEFHSSLKGRVYYKGFQVVRHIVGNKFEAL